MADLTKADFDDDRKGTGTAEWAEVNENVCLGCPNDCLYCYAAANAARLKRRSREDWAREEFTRRAQMKSYPARNGVVMFPTTHDVTPFNLATCVRVAKLILAAGNRLLIVTKPRPECVPSMLDELLPWRDLVLWRFTIGAVDPAICKAWEPGAPPPADRILCLRAARDAGYRTSVSVEPMLAGPAEALATLDAVRPHVTDTVWIGKMNKPRLRIAPGHDEAVAAIEELQSDRNVLWLHDRLRDDPVVRWKDSVKQVVARHSPAAARR